MKCMYVAAVAAALVSTTLFTGCEKDDSLSAKVEQVSKDANKAADKAAKDANKAADKVAKDANKAANSVKK